MEQTTQDPTQQEQTTGPIHKDMTIGEVTSTYPQVIETLMSFGVHCVGCGASYIETIEQGLKGHGMSEEEFQEALKQLNEAAVAGMPKEEPSSDKPLVFSPNALKKLKEMQEKQGKQEHSLRIEVIPGGCSGMSYSFEFVKEPTGEDVVVKIGEGLKIVVDPQSMDLLKGSTVEFVETFQNAGFKIKNPNATGSCGCGQSFN